MEKVLIVMTASTLAAKELTGSEFPFTPNELWTLLFVLVAASITAVSKEASRNTRGPFKPARFWGSVGLGSVAGLAMPLLLSYAVEHLTGNTLTGGASIGLGVLGAYAGRDALKFGFQLLLALGEVIGKLKGLSISFDPDKTTKKKGPPGGEDDA